MNDQVIELRDVSKSFGDFQAVKRADFSIRRGEFFAMLGPSGCGKTTTLKMIAGFEQPTTGQVMLEGVDVSSVPPHKRNVNTVFQQYALFPHMSVADNVAFGLRAKKVAEPEVKSRVAEMLDVVRLGDFATRRPSQLSGGQQQRVALARALVLEPRVLLLDEPLAALDLQLRKGMQEELRRLHRDLGITFIFVTHDQGEAMSMADRIAVMDRGRIEQLDSPDVIYQHPATPFVAGFIGDMNFFPGTMHPDGHVSTQGLGSLRPHQPHPHVPGPVTVCIRPDALQLTPTHADAPRDGIEVTIVDRLLIGEMCRFVVQLSDGQEVIVRRPRSEWKPLTAVPNGSPGQVRWADEDLLILSQRPT